MVVLFHVYVILTTICDQWQNPPFIRFQKGGILLLNIPKLFINWSKISSLQLFGYLKDFSTQVLLLIIDWVTLCFDGLFCAFCMFSSISGLFLPNIGSTLPQS